VPVLARTWLTAARVRRRVLRSPQAREELVTRFAPGRSFADIGCMWSVDGAIAFLAERCGARAVTGLDVMPASAKFEAERAARASTVRFVQGDLHDPAVMAEVGSHQVVWCSGVIYHAPHPLLTLERLHEITGETLILASETIPEVPGVSQACVFLPELPKADRQAHASARPGRPALGITEPFDRRQSYGAWWWGLSASALKGMLAATGFEVVEQHGDALHVTLVARRVD
jgi:2-polyprenyl-3-methyl-5-hydroxy-6-metoxy-1,4-benzoquinol methylase